MSKTFEGWISFLVTNFLHHTLLTLCPIPPDSSTMVFLKQSNTDGILYLDCTISNYGYPLCWNHLVQPLAKNKILNEYGFLCLQNIVDLFQVLISTNMFWVISMVRRTHTRRDGSMPPFLFVIMFLIVGGANFHINIQSAKTCMTSDVMQQILIDVLMFSPYFITSNASLRS